MDNPTVARIFNEIAALLELKAANPFKIRAYRGAAEIIATSAERVADLDVRQLMELPGIGKDLAAKIREIADTGQSSYHAELLEEFPPSILELLRLQGVGPKTVAMLYGTLGIASLDDLATAAREGRLRALKGMGAKKETLILKAIEERQRNAGRHLMPKALAVAAAMTRHLDEHVPGTTIDVVGSLRRGAETCRDIDLLAPGADAAVMEAFTGHPLVERVLGHGETKASVIVQGGFQIDLRVVPTESRGAAQQYFTGSKPHNIALRDRALQRGLKLNEYGLFRNDTDERIAGDTEAGIYEALGLAYIPPELREHRGEVAAAEEGTLPTLIERSDLLGDLHAHTVATDGRDDIESMALATRAAGLRYLAITDHSKALAMANGLDEHRALAHAETVREIGARLEGFSLLAGIECDIRADGTLDLADDCLAQLDVVVASVHSRLDLEESAMTDRLLAAMESPYVDVIGHPTGRLLLRRQPSRLHLDTVLDAAARHGVALEINSQMHRLDLNDSHARLAHERGVSLVIGSDSHSVSGFEALQWGVLVARRAWLGKADVLNTMPLQKMKRALRRNRRGRSATT